MKTPHHSANRTCVILLLVAVAAVLLGVLQHRRLVKLRDEIATARLEASAPAEFRESREEEREADDLREEVRSLLDVLNDPNGPGSALRMARLTELLESLDAAAVRSLLDETGDDARGLALKEALRWQFYAANPREAFRLALGDAPDEQAKRAQVGAFIAWANLDPAGVLKWYWDAEKEGLPLAKEEELRVAVFGAQARLDPKRAIEGFRDHFGKDAGQDAKRAASSLVGGLRSESERMSFMLALNRNTEADPGDGSFRKAVVAELSKTLVEEPFDEASAVIDGTFTKEEREKFAGVLGNGGIFNPDTWRLWMGWVAALNLPAERGQPIANMTTVIARRKEQFKDLTWMAELPAGAQRDLVVETYARIAMESDLQEAVHWLEYLPAGEKRRDVAANVAYYLKMKDPDGAAALRTREGVVE
ncbi:hypothetical protein [Luteolibacter luteus]|uniref:DUF4034 domain-containing protein n=1 Tax=Luteolibacter luteus TaxID=2728835 RepID=A0A858RPB6_9BACT|nr:hypothetical protein [Luteolibacter luteus]QJE98238.1 hypothetical protein HHL09_21445 [Luteolibacter luteus]